MKKVYLWFCDKCNTFIVSTCCLAQSKKAAWEQEGMEEKVKLHDMEVHPTDGELFKGKVEIVVAVINGKKP